MRTDYTEDPIDPPVVWPATAPWPELSDAALHGLAGEYVRALAPHTEADVAALLVTTLLLYGNGVGPSPFVAVGGAQHPARLYVNLVGATGRGRKGQSFADVRPAVRDADQKWFDAAHESGLSSGEGLILRAQGAEPRAFFFEPEFARTLAASGREGATLSPILREAWDSGRLRLRTRKDPLEADGAHISLLSHVTREELRARLTTVDRANGLANRFLFIAVRRSKKLPEGGALPSRLVTEFAGRFAKAFDAARRFSECKRTNPAQAYWANLYANLPEPPGLLGAITGRAEAQILRLSLIYALLDSTDRIDVQHVRAAEAVWSYAAGTAAHVFGGTLGSDLADLLLEELRAVHPEGLTRTKQSKLHSGHRSAAELAAARQHLIDAYVAVERDEPGEGRHPKVLYALPPDEAAEQAEEAAARDPSFASFAGSRENGREPGEDDA